MIENIRITLFMGYTQKDSEAPLKQLLRLKILRKREIF